jgi:mutator protein MutT
VVAAAVIDAAGRVLIAQRPEGKHMAGGWEFPGGKLEAGEERLAGLARELREELGISIETPRPLIRVRHAYPTREVLLDVWVVRRYAGEPMGLDGQALRWCAQDKLSTANLLPADQPIVAALQLPERLRQVFTPHYGISDLSAFRRRRGHGGGAARGGFLGDENCAAERWARRIVWLGDRAGVCARTRNGAGVGAGGERLERDLTCDFARFRASGWRLAAGLSRLAPG